MKEEFLVSVEDLYSIITYPIEVAYKLEAISKFRKTFGKNFFMDEKNKIKAMGVVYTPEPIVEYMIKNTVSKDDIVNNPYIRIVDPACGIGNFIIPMYKYLYNLYLEELSQINEVHNLKLTEESVSDHIIKYNLFGFDVDKISIKLLIINLFEESKGILSSNFINNDFLVDDYEEKFDIIIGNPPYVGQKSIDKEYSQYLKKKFSLYKDKGDLSYCFFQKSLFILNREGKLAFITSRYFLESPSGEELRKVLKDYYTINRIVDFYGIRPFKNIGVDPVIIFLSNKDGNENYLIEVIKPKIVTGSHKKSFLNSLQYDNSSNIKRFSINKTNLNNKGWILRDEKERLIINKIENKSFTNLENICNSYQGIITGCDRAFVVNSEIIKEYNLETDIIKPWIKSSNINKDIVERKDMFLIYSDFIKDEEKFPNCIEYIRNYKDRLLGRRECQKGIRKWYQLQWGRNYELFEKTKIIFPYKASNNRFALDTGSYFSADVYSLILKGNMPFTYSYLLDILNSKIYQYYFKTFGKKLGENIYEYYPNSLMKLCIPIPFDEYDITDEKLYNYFQFTEEQILIIEENQ